jgi:hypothetical protein
MIAFGHCLAERDSAAGDPPDRPDLSIYNRVRQMVPPTFTVAVVDGMGALRNRLNEAAFVPVPRELQGAVSLTGEMAI